jgi:hypothetical protein
VPTASGNSEQNLLKFYASFAKLPATAAHLPLFPLFGRTPNQIRSSIKTQEPARSNQLLPDKLE